MTGRRVRCMFCYAETGDNIIPSKEHLISKPVAAAFGIDRSGSIFQSDADLQDPRWRPLNGISRKCVCTRCNNGWMNQLEHDMQGVADWIKGSRMTPLGEERALTLRKWVLTRHMVLCFLEGGADRFDDETHPQAVLAPFTLARHLYEGDEDAVRSAHVGLARSGAKADFAYAFGHPTMRRTGLGQWSATVAPASAITICDLQVWVATPHLNAAVRLPKGIRSCSPLLRPRDLARVGIPLDVLGVEVDYGADHDAPALIDALRVWAANQSPPE